MKTGREDWEGIAVGAKWRVKDQPGGTLVVLVLYKNQAVLGHFRHHI